MHAQAGIQLFQQNISGFPLSRMRFRGNDKFGMKKLPDS
jgi:hypothetical protein